MWKDFLGKRNSLLSQFSSFPLPDQRLCSENNMYIHIHIYVDYRESVGNNRGQAADWKFRGSNPGRDKGFFSSLVHPDRLLVPLCLILKFFSEGRATGDCISPLIAI